MIPGESGANNADRESEIIPTEKEEKEEKVFHGEGGEYSGNARISCRNHGKITWEYQSREDPLGPSLKN